MRVREAHKMRRSSSPLGRDAPGEVTSGALRLLSGRPVNLDCCQRKCLANFPQILIDRTRGMLQQMTNRDRDIFLLGKISASISLLNLSLEPHSHANKGKPRYYNFDSDHEVCRVTLEKIFGIQSRDLRVLLGMLRKEQCDIPPPPKPPKIKVEEAATAFLPPVLDERKEMEVIRDAMRAKCCPDDCLSKLPDELLCKTRIQIQQLHPRQKMLFLLGKISSSLCSASGADVPAEESYNSYIFDKDYTICRCAFQTIFVITQGELRQIRDRLLEDGTPLGSMVQLAGLKTPKSSIEEEIVAVVETFSKPCCQKKCLMRLNPDLIARTRWQIKNLSWDDRNMFLMGKISASVSFVRYCIISSDRRSAIAFRFDRAHVLCKSASEVVFVVGDVARIRKHMIEAGISAIIHRGKKNLPKKKRKSRAKKRQLENVIEAEQQEMCVDDS